MSEWRSVLPAKEFGSSILLVNEGLAAGGAERQIVNTMLGLSARGNDVRLLCLRLNEDKNQFFLPHLASLSAGNAMSATAAVLTLSRSIDSAANHYIRQCIEWLPADVQLDIMRLAAEFIKIRPSVVHAWQDSTNAAAAMAARLVGVPNILVSCRNLAPRHFGYYREYLLHGYQEIASCPSIKMIANSEAGAQDYVTWLGVPPDRFAVLRNGIDTTRIPLPLEQDRSAARRRFGIREDATVVGSMFRLAHEKRPLLWIEAARQIRQSAPDCTFAIFGDGPLRNAIQTAVFDAGLKDQFFLFPSTPDSIAALSTFDVLLLTSEFEGTPNVALEAACLGIPTVTTDAGGARETIDIDRTGLLSDSQPHQLADAVLGVIRNPVYRQIALLHGRSFVTQKFGLERMLDEQTAHYAMPKP